MEYGYEGGGEVIGSILLNLLVYLPALLFWIITGLIVLAMIFDKYDKEKRRRRYEDDGK